MAVQERYPDAVICDLDGTLALLNGRDPFDWEEVVAMYEDEFNLTVLQVWAVE